MNNTIPPHVIQALNDLNKMLHPAKLSLQSDINGPLLARYAKEQGVDINSSTSATITAALYAGITRHVQERKLEWVVEPKVLRQRDITRVENKNASQYENERTKKRDELEAAEKKSKEDAATLLRVRGAIEAVSITSMGRKQFGKTEQAQATLYDYLAKLVKANTPLSTIETRIRAEITKIYEAAEKGESYSTGTIGYQG